MNKKNAFTLIELLVVISIIAMLLSILLPSLTKAKEKAQSVVCQANLKSWGVVVSLYANNNKDSFWTGYYGQTNPNDEWIWALKPYYENSDLCLCPAATRLNLSIGGPKLAWYIDPAYPWTPAQQKYFRVGDYGSYGSNGWLMNPPVKTIYGGKLDARFLWRKLSNVKRPSKVPVFADSQLPIGLPLSDNRVPAYNGEPFWGSDHLGRFCMKRHSKGMNMVVVDGSANYIGQLKTLWGYKWHNAFDTSRLPADSEFRW